ncbi:hypothetical protein [Leptospira sp. GIMC2001]|uniref:hypothetical protein n=1 Tax=Leptospira sp. GIMC2001 TaxID=1513297 RepID=UPI00234B1867|nr:hypothetical protein [Leptospira sp. GIMC2001]WCL50310.1 hypothetical protein O4O04_05685 [Leptospira sp. GIMC2001]
MKYLLIFFLTSLSLSSNEHNDLLNLLKRIETYNNSFVSGRMITSHEEDKVYLVNYYKSHETFKRYLKQPDRLESIEKWGDRRRWFVSKWKGKEPAIYVSASYNNGLVLRDNEQSSDLKDDYLFYFKNYCEFDGKVDNRYARIKKMRLTYYDSPYTTVNNMNDIKLKESFKRIKSYEIEIIEDEKIINAMQSFHPLKPTTSFGKIFAIQLKVLEVYPGEKNMPLCTSDYYMGHRLWGSYEDVLEEIDELPELKGKRNPY